MEEEIGAILIDLVQCTTNVPGHPVTIIVEQDIEILPHVAHLRKGFVPDRLQRGLCLRRILAIPKQVCSGLRFDSFDIDARDNPTATLLEHTLLTQGFMEVQKA